MTQDHGHGAAPAAHADPAHPDNIGIDPHAARTPVPAAYHGVDTNAPGYDVHADAENVAAAASRAPNIDQLVNQLSPKFDEYIKFLHPENLAEQNAIIKERVSSAYTSFIAYMKTNNMPTYLKQDAQNKRDTVRKTLDSFLLHLIKEFDPAFSNHLAESHFEDETERSAHIRAFASQLFGINSQTLQRAEGTMTQGGDLLEGLELVAQYMRDKTSGYLSHKTDLEFNDKVGSSLYNKTAFIRYLRQTPAFGEYFKGYNGPTEGLEGRLAVNDQLRDQIVQTVIHSGYNDGGKEAMATAIGYKKQGAAPAPAAAHPEPAAHH